MSSVALDARSPQSGNSLRHSWRRSSFDSSLYWTPSQRPNGQAIAADTKMVNVTHRSNKPRAGARLIALTCGALASATQAAPPAEDITGVKRPESVLTTSRPEYFPMPSTGSSSLPFSEAVRSGSTLYVSGQIGTLPGTLVLVPGGIAPEARAALDNLKAILDRHGSSFEQVVKCTVFLADIKEWPAFNEVYREYFKTNLPARSALAASGLALGARVEIECIAFVPRRSH